MAVTQENATICQKCGKAVVNSNFCPYCGEAITQDTTSEEGMDSIPETVSPPSAKTTVWQRLPLWAKILPFVLIVLIAFAPVIVNSISNAAKEAEQKAAEEAFMAGRQALWAEYATRWNSYADQGETAPTKGTQYPFQPVEGYQDAVAFGFGQVSVDLEANYHAPNVLGTVTYESSSGYSETDIYALSYIFAGEEHADELTQSFREYTSTHIPEAISSIQINLSNTTDGTFNPSLEFGYSYADCLRPDDSPYGVSFNTTLTQFIDRWNSYIEPDDNSDFGEMATFAMYGWDDGRVVHTKNDPMNGFDHYMLVMGTTGNGALNVFVHGDYVVEASLAVSKYTYALESKFVANYLNNAMCATGISDMSVGELDNNGFSWQQGILFYGKETPNGNGVSQGCISITKSAYEKLLNGTLEDNSSASSSDLSSDSNQGASSGRTLPYVIRAAEEMPIYSGPGVNYDYVSSLSPSTYTIVEESGGQGANLWGKLKSGAGWITLDHVQLRGSGDDVLETTTNDPSISSPSSSSASIDTFTFEPTPSFSSTPSPSLSTPEPTPAQPTVETIQPEQNQTGYDEDVSFSQLWKNSSYTQKMWPGCTMSKVSEDDCTPASDRKAITPYDFTHLGQGSDFVRFEVLEKWSGNRTGRLVFSCSSKEWTEDTAKELYGELISMLRQTSANGFKDDNDTLMNDFANAYSRWASDTQFSLEIVVTYQPGKAAGLYFYFNGHG